MSATMTRRTVTNHECSFWLRSQLDAIPAAWEASGVRPCPHLAARINAGKAPSTGITALYRSDLLTCPDCIDAFKLTGPADFECDRCHEQADRLDGIIYDTRLAGMRLLVMFGLCGPCQQRELLAGGDTR